MVKVRSLQLEELKRLKLKTFSALLAMAPGYSVKGDRLKKDEALVIDVSLMKNGEVCVIATATEAPEDFVSKIVNPGAVVAMRARWENGFYMNNSGKVRGLHPDIFDDD